MTTYRLPEVLGNAEVRAAVDKAGGNTWPNHLVVEVYDSTERVTWYVLVPKAALTEVKPPLPEEPPVDSVVAIEGHGLFFHRRWGQWQGIRDGYDYDWPKICAFGTPVRLIPAPEPVDLPWVREFEDAPAIIVSRSSASNRAAYVENWGHLTADDARQMARALWTVANEHELEATS